MHTTTQITPSQLPLLPPDAAARYLSVSKGTLRKFVMAGRLTPIRLSERRVAFAPEDLARFIADARVSR